MYKFLVIVAVVVIAIVGLNLAKVVIEHGSHEAQTISSTDLRAKITNNQ